MWTKNYIQKSVYVMYWLLQYNIHGAIFRSTSVNWRMNTCLLTAVMTQQVCHWNTLLIFLLPSLSGFPRKNGSPRPRRCRRSPGKRNVLLKLEFIAAIVFLLKRRRRRRRRGATEQEFNSCSERQHHCCGIPDDHYVILYVLFLKKKAHGFICCLHSP